ncbi:hypothetical protein, partial [Planktothrix sp.]
VTILLKGKKVAVIPALLRMTPEEFEASLSTVLDVSEELENNYQNINTLKEDKITCRLSST